MLYKNSRLSSAMLGNSMLGQIGGSSTGMLTSALQGSSTRPVSKYDKTLQNALGSRLKSYTGIGGSAEGLRGAASALSSKAEDNVFDKARETGSSEELLRQAKAMVNGYNDMMGYGSGGGYLNTNYLSGLLGGGYNFFI
ncbi:MAG: hypothetical protein IJ873_06565 [Lachnospiraceae bacterium]|nr:hypothetical protein [Lachnospiraceae bacterium]